MGLSVTEKQELRTIIAKRIQGDIEQLKRSTGRNSTPALHQQAQAAAYSQLGITTEMNHAR